MNTKYFSIFSSTYGWNIFHSKKNWLRYNQNNKLVSMNCACCYFDIVMEIEFTWQFFLKNPLIIFHVTPSSGSRIVPCGWTDMMNVIVAFQYFANVPIDENLGCYDIYFVTCNWVDTWWRQYSAHLHTDSTQNNTMKQNTQNISNNKYT